jgi:di/tricarboxylate transporter
MVLIVMALVLFAIERIRLQATALLTLVLLIVGFSIWPYNDSAGLTTTGQQLLGVFGNHGLIAVCALMILGKGVEVTQALQPLVHVASNMWGERPKLTMFIVLFGAAAMSAFLNNTPIVVVLLPVLIAIAQQNNASPSKLLMPLGLATIIGGMATTIGTSTNLLVVDLAESIAGLHIAMFDLLPFVAVAGSLGLVYLWLVAPALTPHRESDTADEPSAREYLATLVVDESSPLAQGGTIADLLARTQHRVQVDRIQHKSDTFRLPLPSVSLHAGDHIFVRGTSDALKEAERLLRTSLRTVQTQSVNDPELEPQLVEILVTERSELDGSSLRRSELGETYGIIAVALHRPESGRDRSKLPINRMRLRAGDILLCEGAKQDFERLLAETRLFALTTSEELKFSHRAGIALAIIAGVVLIAALDILPITVSAIVGVGMMRLTKCLAWRHIGQSLSTQVVLIIVVSLALGQALMVTGGDAYIAMLLADMLRGQSPAVTISVLMLIMGVVTNVVSNNAAAVIGTPIGIQLAQQLGIPIMPMVLAVLFGANLSFATPIGYQTNLLVFTAGGYKFTDFVRVGLPLTLLMWAVLSATLVYTFLY